MTRLAALNARITGDSSGFVKAAQSAQNAAQDTTAAMGGSGGSKGLSGATSKASGAIKKLSSSPGMRMLPIQLSQVAQQAAAGGGVMRALSIQAADIGLAFGTMGAIVGTLATVAMPLIIGAFSDAEDEAENFEDALDTLRDTQKSLESTLNILNMSVDELIEKYGTAASTVRNFAIELASVQYQQAIARTNDFQIAIRDVGDEIINISNATGQGKRALRDLANNLGISQSEVQLLADAINNLQSAEGIDAQIAASRALADLMDELNVDAEDIDDSLLDIQAALLEAGIAGAELERVMADVRDRAAEAARASRGIMGVTRGDPGALGGLSGEDLIPPPPGADDEDEDKPGSGRARSQDKFQRDLDRLREQLATEIEVEREMHAQRQEMLREALERELLTQQEFDELMEREKERHQDRMGDIDEAANNSAIANMQSVMGSLSDAFSQGNEEMLRIAKVFGAAEALINAWRTFSQVMADPKLSFFEKLPVALSLFASAMQAVQAIKGVGKGGSGQQSTAGAGAGGAGGQQEPQRPAVSLTLVGDQGFTSGQIGQIVEAINDTSDDGTLPIRLRGRT